MIRIDAELNDTVIAHSSYIDSLDILLGNVTKGDEKKMNY